MCSSVLHIGTMSRMASKLDMEWALIKQDLVLLLAE